ncbi:SDR family NAD(P)-dependent oxidoreductase [Photobacterium rosenbergii]|uniref:SDR family NAD(P)-dependent oxidoreductase n=1 Tax=Photobacterium rosenbergii TaxID=294936 RepID=A0ABU3ZC11_9GAMM|nr:SDR family NAD(P)-dependent oxidoreductase [Photobacterium rosenbergii]MDV5167647.1 SDR family NAD(P)-dependent oxidoreductase [Photobacterium rosenbergii]
MSTNKQVLITGASSGIGKQLAIDYANTGWSVFGCGQNPERLQALSDANENITTVNFDVTSNQDVHEKMSELSEVPNLIILNAGTCEYIDHGQIDVPLFRRVYEVNVFGLLNCIEALQQSFNANTHLVIIGSTASYIPLPRAEAYGSSKAAIAYIANTLAIDLASKGVTVSLVSPGFVKTPLTDKNDFAMPMLMSPEFASEKIREGIEAKKKEIHFPLKFSLFLKFIALLPIRLQLATVKRMTGKTA